MQSPHLARGWAHSAAAQGLTSFHFPRSSCSPGELHAVFKVKGEQIGQKQKSWHCFPSIPEPWEVICPWPILICGQDQADLVWFQLHPGIWSSHKNEAVLTLGPRDHSLVHTLEKRLPCVPGDTTRDVPSGGDYNWMLDKQGVSRAHSGTLCSRKNTWTAAPQSAWRNL